MLLLTLFLTSSLAQNVSQSIPSEETSSSTSWMESLQPDFMTNSIVPEEEQEEEEPIEEPHFDADFVPVVMDGEPLMDMDPTILEEEQPMDDLADNQTIPFNLTLSENGNGVNGTNNSTAKGPKKANCIPRTFDDPLDQDSVQVEIVNGSHLIQHILGELALGGTNVTSRSSPANCTLVFFYASWCQFSARAAPYFNRLARLYPELRMMAVDSGLYHNVNTKFGIMAIPSVLLFHSTKFAARYNQSDYDLERLVDFISNTTEFEPQGNVSLTEADFQGPLPVEAVVGTDYMLYLAWATILICGLGFFGKSTFCRWILESIRRTWREAEIQHEHQD